MPDVARPITSTYRLQLHAGFGFAAAEAVVPYLARLGVSHLYLSPILQATPGSMHGYDVVDHALISDHLGGRDGIESLAAAAHDHGLGIVVDVVPNHMAIPEPARLNRQLWDVLRLGQESSYAHWFDVDWDALDGRLGLAVLGAPLADVVAAGELSVQKAAECFEIAYYEQRFPVAPGTESGSVDDVLARQHYLLADWHDKADVLNYRRFFDVDTLIAIRVELDDVFDATHAVLLELARGGVIDGFRIDHPDGLADPEGYLARLRDASNGMWVVVEKILAGNEALPSSWAAAGTTGYDAATALRSALVPDTGHELDELWRTSVLAKSDEADAPSRDGEVPADAEATAETSEAEAKREITAILLPEVRRLARLVVRAAADKEIRLVQSEAEAALAAMLRRVTVYRAYVRCGEPPPAESIRLLEELQGRAAMDRPDLATSIAVITGLLVDTGTGSDAGRDLIVRFQQVSGPVMAKSVEDTSFYRYNRLIALNEVGGDPTVIEEPDVGALHRWAQRQAVDWPRGMTTLTTHDTKRSEDVRGRLLAAAEDIEGWSAVWARVARAAGSCGVDLPTAYLVFQTVVGAWPIDEQRLHGYLEKAVREAKRETTWQQPDTAYETGVLRLADTCLNDLGPVISAWVTQLEPATRAITLGAKLVQLMLPGVPDVYQGTEFLTLTLVDPDNRRPVEYDVRSAALDRLGAGEAPATPDEEKLWIVTSALRLRRRLALVPPQGQASYEPLKTTSPHAFGFRRDDVTVVATRWPGSLARRGWDGALARLAAGRWDDVLTGRQVEGDVDCGELLSTFPVALLLRSAGSGASRP